MNFLGKKVVHSRFGTGIISNQTQTNIEVDFGGEYGVKKFVYPSVFGGFLTFTDPALQTRAVEQLRLAREGEAAERERRAQEAENKRLEEHQAQLAQKRASTKKRSQAKPTAKK